MAADRSAWWHSPTLWRLLLLVLLGVVAWLAFVPQELNLRALPHDKLRHFAAFAVLAAVAWWAYAGPGPRPWWLALALFAFGVFIELVQSQIPGRDASAADLVANSLGIACGLALARRLPIRA